MKRNNSISRTFPLKKSYSFPKEFRKRFSDIFTSPKNNAQECKIDIDHLTPSYKVTEHPKMKREMIFVSETNSYIEIEIEHYRNVIRTRGELLELTSPTLSNYDKSYHENSYQDNISYEKDNKFLSENQVDSTSSRDSISSYRSIITIVTDENNENNEYDDSDSYSIDSYYHTTNTLSTNFELPLNNELSETSIFYQSVHDKLDGFKNLKISNYRKSIYSQSDSCSICSLSSISSSNSILGKNILPTSNPIPYRNSV